MTDAVARLSSALSERYRIERELGQGGMATVYLAHDVRHDRKVALKVLRPELAAILGGERFLKEIRTTANLQHPHILALHDSGEAEGLVFYVMPYVEGESLRDRLTREKQLPVDEAVRIAREVAGALDYAHRHGVVHRDIKPENILLQDGSAMVADFGIALAASRSEGSTRMTETGMSLGTPHYMAPEQAMGEREITPKADVYALGCVTYEMLTGEPPFTGPTAQAIIARVMTEEPRGLTLQRRTIPPHVEAAVFTALSKLPADRYATAAEFSQALEDGGRAVGRYGGTKATMAANVRRGPTALPPYRLAALLAGVFAAGALVAWFARPRAHAVSSVRMSMTMPTEASPIALRLSPDGTTLAFAAAGAGDRPVIYVRQLDQFEARRLEGTEDAASLSFSPDGEWIAYTTGGLQARRVPVSGGASVPIAIRNDVGAAAIEYSNDGRYIIVTGSGSLAVLNDDGTSRVFADHDSAGVPYLDIEQVLPNGWALVRPWQVPPNGPIVAYNIESGDSTLLVDAVCSWAGYSEETLAWALTDGTLYAAPFSLRQMKVTGPSVPVGALVLSILGFPPPASFERGALAFAPTRPRSLVRVNRDGIATALLTTDRTYHNPRVAPGGRRVAFDFTEQQRDVWIFDLADSTLTRFGFDSTAHDAIWLPDGSGLLFSALRGGNIGVFRRRFAATAVESISTDGPQLSAHTVTPDGRIAIAARISRDGQFDLAGVHLQDGKLDMLLSSRYNEGFPSLSPDGRWLAYAADESGRNEVYVRSFPDMGLKVQVSQDGGNEPIWSRDGREIFYRSGGRAEPLLTAAAVEMRPTFRVVRRVPLFSVASYEVAVPHQNYDVFPDGRSFVMVRQGRPGQNAEVKYILGLPALARRRSR